MQELSGKVAVVTGAASGIGLAMVQRFGAQGMSVVLADVEADALEQAAKQVAADLGDERVLGVVTDVRDPDALLALRDATFGRFGTAHVLCNNAGVSSGGPTWTIEPSRFRWVIEVDLLSVQYGVHAFVPRMVEQGEGHVVNTASAAGLITGPGMSPYFAAKHAVVALSECLQLELAQAGGAVGVTVLCPEWVRTRIHESERNLPVGMARPGSDDPGAGAMRGFIAGLIEGGTDPLDIADLIVAAVKDRTFYVLPHAASTILRAKARWAAIEAGGMPTSVVVD